MKPSEVNEALSHLDGRGLKKEYDAIRFLLAAGVNLPTLLHKKYKESKKWGERASCVYHSIKYAKNDEDAFQLGIEALNDKSKVVRYRACMLLSVAQNTKAIPYLEKLLTNEAYKPDALAAIDAIKHRNQNYFVDREHSGMVTLNV
jgi:hypothetical protein